MQKFIKNTRCIRNKEIQYYENIGYGFEDKNKYLLIDKIQVEYYGEKLSFGIRVSNQEPYFIYIHQGANINFTIVDIYHMFSTAIKKGLEVVDDLKKQLSYTNESGTFLYDETEYLMIEPLEVNKIAELIVPQTYIGVPYHQIIVLLALIQSKSNCFFSNSHDANKRYVNGIYRLLICLLLMRKDHPILNERGWIWDNKLDEFQLQKEKAKVDLVNAKYYLTQVEMEAIMKT